MRYQIFEMTFENRLVQDGWAIKTRVNYTLDQELFPDSYQSYSDAKEFIAQNPDSFKGKKITILPVVEFDFEGVIKL